jgi:hypothetical protein
VLVRRVLCEGEQLRVWIDCGGEGLWVWCAVDGGVWVWAPAVEGRVVWGDGGVGIGGGRGGRWGRWAVGVGMGVDGLGVVDKMGTRELGKGITLRLGMVVSRWLGMDYILRLAQGVDEAGGKTQSEMEVRVGVDGGRLVVRDERVQVGVHFATACKVGTLAARVSGSGYNESR